MDNKEYIQSLVAKAKEAQAVLDTFSQEKIDQLTKAMGMAIFDAAQMLSEEAVAETKYGTVESKVGKHKGVTTATWWAVCGKPSVGLIEDTKDVDGILKFAKPMGVLASITPVTNPTTTAATNAMNAIKTRNAIIVAPHPAAKKCTAHACKIMSDKLVELGAPANLVQSIEEPSIELTGLLMSACDVIVATGGPSMVKAAYSSGTPAYGVGQGNSQLIVGPDWTDYDTMAQKAMFSRNYDNGVPCTGEQTFHVPAAKREEIIAAFVRNGGYDIKDPAEVDKVRKNAFNQETGKIQPKIVGQKASGLAKMLGIDGVPEETICLLCRVDGLAEEDILSKEILAPIIRFVPYNTPDEAIENCRRNYFQEGAGHTGGIWSNDDALIEKAAARMPVCRYLVNQPLLLASGSPVNLNGYIPTSSLGCGSWGGNSISENFNYKHLLNTTRVAYIIPGKKILTPDEIWALDE
ncbi:MAG: aldehyde dehydrogenase family protein [Clostridia bacterium]|nr:aldehyde dehydrogenase family protein [Clostridia bacterium]